LSSLHDKHSVRVRLKEPQGEYAGLVRERHGEGLALLGVVGVAGQLVVSTAPGDTLAVSMTDVCD